MIFSRMHSGVMVFLTTHYLEEAEDAHRVGMTQNGVLKALATPAELKRDSLRCELVSLTCDSPIQAGQALREALMLETPALRAHVERVAASRLAQIQEVQQEVSLRNRVVSRPPEA
jgi:ABC-type multidrug transport system ATPase subunit